MANSFLYLLEKLEAAPFSSEPFSHIEIRNFLSNEHFEAIVSSPEIKLNGASSTEELLGDLRSNGYQVITFPGTVTSEKEYLRWFHGKSKKKVHAATEGFGIVYRLMDYDVPLLRELEEFFDSEELMSLLKRKFGIDRPVEHDGGIQKYLHGYEISPHPDIRRKALTWMLNINPGENTEDSDFHTQYLRLKDKWTFIGEFWKSNPEYDRDWVPWAWCETVKRQQENNSIVFFSPSNDTMHAVRANYDHLKTQRTQFYGNLWYEKNPLQRMDSRYFDLARNIEVPGPLTREVRKLKATLKAKLRPTGARKVNLSR